MTRVYISCHYMHDWPYCDRLVNILENEGHTVRFRQDVIEDRHLRHPERVNMVRSRYIRDSEVMVVLCGRFSNRCPIVDRELCAAMNDLHEQKRMGILAIALPELGGEDYICREDSPSEGDDVIARLRGRGVRLPRRLEDNIAAGVQISILSWESALNNTWYLSELIGNAGGRRGRISYVNCSCE